MVNSLHDFMTKDKLLDLSLHIFRKIVLYQPPRVCVLICTTRTLHSSSLYSNFLNVTVLCVRNYYIKNV